MGSRREKWRGNGRASLSRLAALLGLLVAVGAAGCGEEEAAEPAPPEQPGMAQQPSTSPQPPGETEAASAPAAPARLTGAERRLLSRYDRRIQAHCVRVARSLVEPGAAPTPAQRERAFAAADALVALAARKPRAPLGAGQDLRLFVSDVVENLEGSNCDPQMISRLAQGLATLPAH